MSRYRQVVEGLREELMQVLESNGHGNYLSHCRSYAQSIVDGGDLLYSSLTDSYYAQDDGSDYIQISKHDTKTSEAVLIDVSDL